MAPSAPPRLGLALSGGGFRAALYHVGVVAALAEAGLLGRVEALSAVSGGSVVGYHLFLLLKVNAQLPAERGRSPLYRRHHPGDRRPFPPSVCVAHTLRLRGPPRQEDACIQWRRRPLCTVALGSTGWPLCSVGGVCDTNNC